MALQLLTQTYRIAVKFTGLRGELRIDSDNWDLLLDDGVTVGGFRFLNQENADKRYQARSPELDGLLEFEPQDKGWLVRRGPKDYRVREITVNKNNLSITNPKGYGGNPLIGLLDKIASAHMWQESQTFLKQIKATGGLEGDLVGDVTGDVTGNLHGDSTGKHTGSVDASDGELTLADKSIKPEYLADAISIRLVPAGAILMWAGAVADIPNGWRLCNGLNNTPDLRDRFILGAGGDQSPHDAGGNEQLVNPFKVVKGGSHSHTIAGGQTGKSVTGITVFGDNTKVDAGSSAKNVPRLPFTVDDPGHTHNFDGLDTSDSGEHTHELTVDQELLLPAFYSLCYIMKVA